MRAAEFAERESDMLPEGDRFVMIRVHRGAKAAQSVQDPKWIVHHARPRPSSVASVFVVSCIVNVVHCPTSSVWEAASNATASPASWVFCKDAKTLS